MRVLVCLAFVLMAGCRLDTSPIFLHEPNPDASTTIIPVDAIDAIDEGETDADVATGGADAHVPRGKDGGVVSGRDAALPDGSAPDDPLLDAGPDASQIPDATVEAPDAGDVGAVVPGAVFSPCTETSECDADLVCTAASITNVLNRTGYCTAPCMRFGTDAAECPQPNSGSVMASCQLTTGRCELSGCRNQQCPSDMQCVQGLMVISRDVVIPTFDCKP